MSKLLCILALREHLTLRFGIHVTLCHLHSVVAKAKSIPLLWTARLIRFDVNYAAVLIGDKEVCRPIEVFMRQFDFGGIASHAL